MKWCIIDKNFQPIFAGLGGKKHGLIKVQALQRIHIPVSMIDRSDEQRP